MSKSQIACNIDQRECSVVRMKTSGSDGYSLSSSKTFPFGTDTLASPKSERHWKKLIAEIGRWPGENLALSVEPLSCHPLPATFSANVTHEAAREYCRIEAAYFLHRPEEYLSDITGCTSDSFAGDRLEKKLLIFYPAEPCLTAKACFAATHPVNFSGSSIPSTLYLSKLTARAQVLLELEEKHMLLAVTKNGQMEKFVYRKVKNREEARYFTIKELLDNPVCLETDVQVTGKLADRAMTKMIQKETSVNLVPFSIPSSIAISNPNKFRITSPSTVRAISTALMALDGKR
ncbi:MAG: hypothetical protein HGB23_00220 [Chlorobiaceae bacterium]|nr:hypothetical protein [Chlorobiaceae bacterium]